MQSRRSPAVDSSEIRVVIQNGEYWLCNKGDLAMLTVTVRRLRKRWPNARIGVLTSAPHLLRAYLPEAEPISDRNSGSWPGPGVVARWSAQAGPRIVGPPSVGWLTLRERPRQYARRLRGAARRPLALLSAGRPRTSPTPVGPAESASVHRIPAALHDASLLLAMGGGYLTDVDPEQTTRTFDLLEHAADTGIPTALLGQGIGPIDDPALLARAARVLPRVDFIALREGLRGPGLLDRFGVPTDRTSVTGDDAIELAYDVRREHLGSDIGVCLRVADYSPVAALTKQAVRRSVQRVAREVDAGLVPLIISEYQSEDRRSTLPLVLGFEGAVRPLGRYVAPEELASRVSRCRVLVTGAYHLAVFALAQGIPVVGLSASTYYDDKLLGLSAMFSGGLQLVRLHQRDLESRLTAALRAAWAEAPAARSPLRARAVWQIEASKQGFEQVFELVETSSRRAVDRT